MDWTALGLGLVTVVALVGYITRPWWGRGVQAHPTPVRALAGQREATLAALRDLEFDHEVGKVTEADYISLQQTLLAKAAAIMAQLEQEQEALDAQIEADILVARQTLNGRRPAPWPDEAGRVCPTCSRPAHPDDLYCRGCGTLLAPTCSRCGQTVAATDRFCVNCGVEVTLAVAG